MHFTEGQFLLYKDSSAESLMDSVIDREFICDNDGNQRIVM